jgi:hypothetical protein
LGRRLGGPQSRSGRGGEEKNSQPPLGIEPQNPNRPACSPALQGKNKISKENSFLEYLLLFIHMTLFCAVILQLFEKEHSCCKGKIN